MVFLKFHMGARFFASFYSTCFFFRGIDDCQAGMSSARFFIFLLIYGII